MIYILHQVNCMNAFGAGFARYIAEVAPKAKQAYHEYCQGNKGINLLGQYCAVHCTDKYDIVHIFSQYRYGNGKRTNTCFTDYEAMESALATFRMNHPDTKAICPKYMGCGLAGGDWNIVSKLLNKYNIIPCSNIDLRNCTYRL